MALGPVVVNILCFHNCDLNPLFKIHGVILTDALPRTGYQQSDAPGTPRAMVRLMLESLNGHGRRQLRGNARAVQLHNRVRMLLARLGGGIHKTHGPWGILGRVMK